MPITNEQIDAFVNALQLCLGHPLIKHRYMPVPSDKLETSADGDIFLMSFTTTELNDEGLKKFKRLVSGESKPLDKYSHQYWIKNFQQLDLSLLTNFLLLTRLQDDQIVALANQDPRYRPYAKALGLLPAESDATPILSLSQARDLVFQVVERKGISLAILARQAGLSTVSLSNFKAGGDIRLSNLLKIAKALGIKVAFH